MKFAYDIVALIAVTCLIAGTIGYQLAMREKGPRCPTVPGAKVAATVDEKDGQTCMYIHDLAPGQKRLSVRL